MKKFLLTVLFLLCVIVGGLGFFIIRSFNADNFQKQIVKTVSEITGREFNVMGATYVSWVPSPEIILNDVTLANVKGSTRGVMLSIPRVSIQLTWKSLLKNPLVIDKIKVENPVLYLERMASDKVNWNFSFMEKNAIENSMLGLNNSFVQTRINNLQVKNGVLNYSNAVTNSNLELLNINGRITLDSLQGPYVFDGSVQNGESSYLTKLSVKQLTTDIPVPFSLDMSAKDKSLSLNFEGEFLSQSKNLNMTANGSFFIQKPNDMLKTFGLIPLSADLNVPAQGGLTYTAQNGVDSIKNFTIRFGDTEDSVALTASASREEKEGGFFYTGSFAINHLDYAQWADVINYLKKQDLNNPKNPNFDIKMNAQKITYQNNVFKDVGLSLSKTDNRMIVHYLNALLEGETELSSSGGTLVEDGKNGLSLIVNLKSKNFKKLLSGYMNAQNIPSNVLNSAQLDANVLLWNDSIDVDISSFESGGSVIVGKMQILKDKKPTINFDGSLKNINLDNYTGYKHAAQKTDILDVIPSVKSYFRDADYLTLFNSKFNLDLKDITARQLPISHGKLVGSLENGLLKISELRATGVAMAALLAAAEIEDVATDAQKIKNLRLDFNTNELKLFLDRANLVSNNQFLNQTNSISTTLQVTEDQNVWTGSLRNKIGELETRFSGTLNYAGQVVEAKDLGVEITYPSFQQFLKNVLLSKKINNSIEGAFSFKGILNGNLQNLKFAETDVQIGTSHLLLDGELKNTTTQKSIDLKVKTPSFDMDRYILNDFKNVLAEGPLGNTAFNFSLLDIWKIKLQLDAGQILWHSKELKNASVKLNIQDKMLTLENLSGVPSVEGTSLKTTGTLSWAGVPHLKANVDLSGLELGANIITGGKTSFGNGVLTFSGDFSMMGQSPNEMRKNMSGSGKMNVENALWVGADIQKIPALIGKTIKERSQKHVFDSELSRYLNSGKTILPSLLGNFTIEKGVFKMMDASLKADAFYSNPMQVVYNIPTRALDVSVPITLAEYGDLPPFALSLKGSSLNPVYQTNFVDLSNAVEDIVQQGNTKIAEQLQKEKEQLAKITLNERVLRIKQAINEARDAVKAADEKLFAGDNDSAAFLLQNAKDALAIVNQLSVKEKLTDAQYIQLMEQSRLAILKAQEAVDEAVRDLYFEDRKQVQTFVKQSQEMLSQMKLIHDSNPEIEIVSKLLVPVSQYVEVLQETNMKFSNEMSNDEHDALMQTARDAFSKIVHAYEYVSRFEPEGVERIVPVSINQIPNQRRFEGAEETYLERESETEYSPKFQGQIIRR
ncbi:MAG: AsmA family protein [Alphaproteobacteria bacterium]|nr:AsmA family protein [Alphaproteobacteria bacterium]